MVQGCSAPRTRVASTFASSMAPSDSSPTRSASARGVSLEMPPTANRFPATSDLGLPCVALPEPQSEDLHRRENPPMRPHPNLYPVDRVHTVPERANPTLHEGGPPAEFEGRQLRIALYSPGIAGLGHMRRNLLIGQTLVRSFSDAVILMIAEARQACAFAMPPRMDCLSLPALRKLPDGKCQPRYLGTSLHDLMHLRATVIHRAIEAFEPDLLITDFLPRGRHGELGTTLEYLRFRTKTRCVLGLRDVLENPAWARHANEDEIRAYYDAVWVFRDPVVYGLIREHEFSDDLRAKMCYTGYLDQRARLDCVDDQAAQALEKLDLPPGRLVLCSVGGGWDGAPLAEAFVQAELPPATNGVLLT